MGKKGNRNKRNDRSAGNASLQEQLRALASTSGNFLSGSVAMREAIEQGGARQQEEMRRTEIAQKTKRLLLLPHAIETGSFYDPLRSGFVNPYTFFPLEDQKPQKWDIDAQELSGHLTCSLEVAEWSPLFVPNTSGVFVHPLDEHDASRVHKSYEFFSYEDLSDVAKENESLVGDGPAEPIIPGSELRGMTRSVYVQLTNSCLPIVDEKSDPIKRTNLPKRPYRMEWDATSGVWKLYETNVYKLGAKNDYKGFEIVNARRRVLRRGRRAYEELREGYVSQWNAAAGSITRQVLVCDADATGWYRKQVSVGGTATAGVREYYLHATGEIGGWNNHNHLLLYPVVNSHAGAPLCRINENSDLFARFRRVLDAYCERTSIPNHNAVVGYYEAYRAMLDQHQTVLVYADSASEPMHLSPSSMSPESYHTRAVKLMGDHAPCTGPVFCPACRLFGMVGSRGQLGSRVRFSDGSLKEGSESPVYCEPTTLAPLSTPRPSATEFYLKRPDGVSKGTWNHDYVLQSKTGKDGKSYLAKAPTPYADMPGSGIQGRKVYLHSAFDLHARYTDDAFEMSTQNVTVRPLKRGTFTFDVFFQDLTAHELATLIYALGGMDEGRLQKLGHGRPLGMGSVLVKVEACHTKTYSFDVAQGIVCASDTLDNDWVSKNLPDDERDVARRKLVTFLAQDLRKVRHRNGTLSDVVSYPKPKEGPICGDVNSPRRNQTFEWFRMNRGSVLEPTFSNVLNTLSVEEVMTDDVWKTLSE